MDLINKEFCILFLCVFYGFSEGLAPTSYLTAADKQRLKKVLSFAFPLSDLAITHYGVLGYSLLGEKIPTDEDICKYLDSKLDKKRLDSIFHASSASLYIPNCNLKSTGIQQVLDAAIKEDSPMQDIYHAVLSARNLKLTVDSAKVAKVMTTVLKRDDSVAYMVYSINVAANLEGDMTKFYDRIEDILVQADLVEGKYYQLEGGLASLSLAVNGMYKLSEALKKAPPFSENKGVALANYFLTRKYVQTIKGAAQVLVGLKTFVTNKFLIPISITMANSNSLSAENPEVQVRVVNMMGASLGPLNVTLVNARRTDDNSVVMTNKTFKLVKGSDGLYTINLMNEKPEHLVYNISIIAASTKGETRLYGLDNSVLVKIVTTATIETAEIGTVDRDQVTPPKAKSITYPKTEVKLQADFHQKVFMKFTLKDLVYKKLMVAQQTFVQFVNTETKQEVFFVAEPDSNLVYKFDLDVVLKAKDFNYASGVYDINLIVGDAVLLNPFIWKIGQVTFTFPLHPNPSSEETEYLYKPKPEIKHAFREKDKSPPAIVSTAFSVLIILPLLFVLIAWTKLGANMSNFPFSVAAVVFHLGLLSIFALFTCFWLHLNMFSTLKYLTGVGVVTFLSGHKLLSRLAANK